MNFMNSFFLNILWFIQFYKIKHSTILVSIFYKISITINTMQIDHQWNTKKHVSPTVLIIDNVYTPKVILKTLLFLVVQLRKMGIDHLKKWLCMKNKYMFQHMELPNFIRNMNIPSRIVNLCHLISFQIHDTFFSTSVSDLKVTQLYWFFKNY